MTNEEIQKAVTDHPRQVYAEPPALCPQDGFSILRRIEYAEQVESLVRSLVSQAYEEAARIADSHDSASNGNHARDVADEVRAMKASLESEPVSA